MSVAVRYFSKLGNTKQIAEAIVEGAQTTAVSIVDEPALAEYVDVLFLGGAPYANIMDPQLKSYGDSLKPEMVGKVVLFTASKRITLSPKPMIPVACRETARIRFPLPWARR